MEVYRDLFIRGSADQIAAAVDEIDQSLADGWSRDRETEERMRTGVMFTRHPICFACNVTPGRPAATVFLTERISGTLSVSNVVPKELEQLSYREYNVIVS